jgi:UDP-glucose 4-epimerase
MAEGARVEAISRSPVEACPNSVRWRQCDLLDLEAVTQLLDETSPDFIFHLSGHVSASPQIENVLPVFHSLLTSTVNLLTLLADRHRTRLVITGSLTEPYQARADYTPSSPYAAAKWSATGFARMFHALYGVPVVIARPYMVYGPRQKESKVVPHTITSLVQGIPPRLTSGTWVADWIYISDIVEGLILAATVEGVEGCTFDLGSGETTSIKDVVHRIAGIMHSNLRPAFGALPDRPFVDARPADVEHSLAKLGWRAKVSLDDGLAATVSWFTRQA